MPYTYQPSSANYCFYHEDGYPVCVGDGSKPSQLKGDRRKQKPHGVPILLKIKDKPNPVLEATKKKLAKVRKKEYDRLYSAANRKFAAGKTNERKREEREEAQKKLKKLLDSNDKLKVVKEKLDNKEKQLAITKYESKWNNTDRAKEFKEKMDKIKSQKEGEAKKRALALTKKKAEAAKKKHMEIKSKSIKVIESDIDKLEKEELKAYGVSEAKKGERAEKMLQRVREEEEAQEKEKEWEKDIDSKVNGANVDVLQYKKAIETMERIREEQKGVKEMIDYREKTTKKKGEVAFVREKMNKWLDDYDKNPPWSYREQEKKIKRKEEDLKEREDGREEKRLEDKLNRNKQDLKRRTEDLKRRKDRVERYKKENRSEKEIKKAERRVKETEQMVDLSKKYIESGYERDKETAKRDLQKVKDSIKKNKEKLSQIKLDDEKEVREKTKQRYKEHIEGIEELKEYYTGMGQIHNILLTQNKDREKEIKENKEYYNIYLKEGDRYGKYKQYNPFVPNQTKAIKKLLEKDVELEKQPERVLIYGAKQKPFKKLKKFLPDKYSYSSQFQQIQQKLKSGMSFEDRRELGGDPEKYLQNEKDKTDRL